MISVVIPTYRRGQVLVDTVAALLEQGDAPGELIVVDQTEAPEAGVAALLQAWAEQGRIQWCRRQPPGTAAAMNEGLRRARGELVLFLDDDIAPGPGLVQAHAAAHGSHPEAWCVVGQILQPGETAEDVPYRGRTTGLAAYETFAYRSCRGQWIGNVMAGNMSVRRERAVALGGFDENFIPPVAYRLETEFAWRLQAAGGRIWFEPQAGLRHLRAGAGGTRSNGGHLGSGSPVHGVGDYYYALRCGRGWDRFRYMVRRPFREVRTRFHLRHPWWIPVKFIGEWRAMALAISLARRGPRLMA